ncbi:MAG TPA: efflux RND transporter periplasmic adaptor subunit [Steroidobacteraceae bacterium]|jgi:RND family efflux transporter MFP subunit
MNDVDPTALQRRLRPLGIVAALIVFAIIATGIGLRLHAQTVVRRWTEQQAIPTVALIAPKAGVSTEQLTLPGNVRAYFEAPIYARVSGYLRHWYFDIGAHVRAGQVLADIDTPELDQQLNQAEADLATARANEQLAETTAARWKNMLASQSVSQQESDEKSGAYAANRALLAAAQANLQRLKAIAAFKHVTAPFDGIVTARDTDLGALINAGSGGDLVLFRVADVHAMRIYVDVPQNYAGELQIGTSAELSLPERPGAQVSAKVTDLSRAIRESSRTMQVELLADNAQHQLMPGEYAEVHFTIAAQAGVVEVPTTALLFRQEGLQVATVDAHDHIVLKPIQLARERGAVVDVSQGLTPQDRVVDNPPDSIANGEPVRIAAPAQAPASSVSSEVSES